MDRTQEPKRRILVADSHPVFRRGMAALIASDRDLIVCAQVDSSRRMLQSIDTTRPDLVTVDLPLDGCDGLELVRDVKARYPSVPALVISMQDETVYAPRALRAGALGYVNKRESDATVLSAIRRLLAGETYMSAGLEAQLAGRYVRGQTLLTGSTLDVLSDRELQVFELIGSGNSTREIAGRLSLSIKTIESHRGNIKSKLGLGTAAQLTQRAIQWVETGRSELASGSHC